MTAGTVALHDDGAVILNADGTVGVRQSDDDPACCCGGERCDQIATICDCSIELYPDAPEVILIPCENVAFWLQTSAADPMIVRVYYGGGTNPSGACYQVGSASPTWPPPGEDPTPPGGAGTIAQVLESCEACCPVTPPVFCWARVGICGNGGSSCPGGFITNTFVFLGERIDGVCPPIPDGIWKYQESCVYVHSSIVNELPPGAVVIAPFNQYDSCQDCCDDVPPKGCPLTCDGCPPTLTITVPSWTIPFGGGITIDVTGGMVPVQRIVNTCNWETIGDPIEFAAVINSPGDPPEPLPFFLSGAVSCSPQTGWVATIDGSVFCAFVSNNFDPCPFAGGYNCQMAPGGCDSCPPNVSVG